MLRSTFVFGFLSLVFGAHAVANPNAKSPEAPLDLHNLTKAQEILTPALPLLSQCTQTIPNLPEQGEKNAAATLSKLHVALLPICAGPWWIWGFTGRRRPTTWTCA